MTQCLQYNKIVNHSKIVLILALCPWGLAACAGTPRTPAALCPAEQPAPVPVAGVLPSERTINYWIARVADPDKIWLDQRAIRSFNRTLFDPARALPVYDLNRVDAPALEEMLQRRLRYLDQMVRRGAYRGVPAPNLASAPLPSNWQTYLAPTHHTATAPVAMYCGPFRQRLVAVNDPLQLDRNRCSTVEAGEDLQVLASWPNGMRLARTYYTFGWISGDAPLSEPRAMSRPLADSPTLPLTRRRWMSQAFSLLDRPYGWGGENDGLDCSSFVMQVFRPLGLMLPRHSRHQVHALPHTIEVPAFASDTERLSLIDSAHAHGVVLLHFPGHIMIYLGRDHRGTPMVIHAFAQYLRPCGSNDGREIRMLVKRVEVSPLSLGEHTSSGSLLGRIDTLGVLGTAP